jgi:hypothetical protein
VPASVVKPPYPFLLRPATAPFVRSSHPITSDRFFSDIGSLVLHMSYKWAVKLLTDLAVPMASSAWFATPLIYESPIETDATACLADMLVIGPSTDPIPLQKPPRTNTIKKSTARVGPQWDMLFGFDSMDPPTSSSRPSRGGGRRIGRGGRGGGRGDVALDMSLLDGFVEEPAAEMVLEGDGDEESEDDMQACACRAWRLTLYL